MNDKISAFCVESLEVRINRTNSFLESILQMIQQQSSSLQNLTIKMNELAQKTAFLEESQKLKKTQTGIRFQSQSQLNQQNYQQHFLLLKQLFGATKNYQYRLQLVHSLELPLYNEINFSFQLQLVTSNGEPYANSNKIPLTVALYSSEESPKYLSKNTKNQKLLKGFTDKPLQKGFCTFTKMQIRDVTSHYTNGWIYLVVIPSMTPLSADQNQKQHVCFQDICPLIIDKVVVKAKRMTRKQPILVSND